MSKSRFILISLILFSGTLLGERTKLKPGTNAYKPEDDVKLGREVAKDAEMQLVLIKQSDANAYVSALGERLVTKAPNEYKFPFYFKIVDDRSINAFALPGGPVYVNRGAIEAADNEAQLAGVMAHEIGHVVLRHGTNQATKGGYLQGIAGVLGSIFGGGAGQAIGALGGFAANSILLRYSREAESQADLMGTQILYDSGYDPQAMAQFFDKLAKEHKGTATEQFFSNHPIPENRVLKVNDEIRKMGGAPPNPKIDSAEFQSIKKVVLSLPEPPKPNAKPASSNTTDTRNAPALPSTRMVSLEVAGIRLNYPNNWKPVVQGNHVTLAPDRGMDAQGNVAYGMVIDVFTPQGARTLDQATTQFLNSLKQGNPAMKIVRSGVQARVNGAPAQVAELSNDSPAGGQETDVVITVMRSAIELLYFVEVAPSSAFSQYRAAFNAIMNSVQFR